MYRVATIPAAVARMSEADQKKAIALTGIGRTDESDLDTFIIRQAWCTYPTRERCQQDADFYNTRAPFPYVEVIEAN